ncbi:MAG: hypothetical protein Q9M24_02760 [Mariprofundaceae bacterium]|nr:hypothetical protein [Mariprofundaceae bacterium]
MPDDPSIDEILKSLDHLLREGTEKNDDYSGDIQAETDEADQQPESRKDEVQAPEQPVVEAPDDMEEADDLSVSDAEEIPELEHSRADMDDAPHPPRMLLSESMLVDNPQEHLPFDDNTAVEREGSGAGDDNAGDDNAGEETAPGQACALDDAKIKELTRHVSDELIRRLHARLGEALPGMVDDAVRQYMEGLKPED